MSSLAFILGLSGLSGSLRVSFPRLFSAPTSRTIISPWTASKHNAFTWSSMESRGFKTHIQDTLPHSYGRSVTTTPANGNPVSPIFAASQLRHILQQGRVRETVRMQARFERNHDRKKRLRKERDWATYLRHVRRKVQEAWDCKKQSDLARRTYQDI